MPLLYRGGGAGGGVKGERGGCPSLFLFKRGLTKKGGKEDHVGFSPPPLKRKRNLIIPFSWPTKGGKKKEQKVIAQSRLQGGRSKDA